LIFLTSVVFKYCGVLKLSNRRGRKLLEDLLDEMETVKRIRGISKLLRVVLKRTESSKGTGQTAMSEYMGEENNPYSSHATSMSRNMRRATTHAPMMSHVVRENVSPKKPLALLTSAIFITSHGISLQVYKVFAHEASSLQEGQN
jgi:hypothetical protein